MAVMLGLHNALRSWQHNIDCFIYINAAQKKLLTKVGFPKEKFIYKPNFLPVEHTSACPKPETAERQPLRLLFAGRLSEEKGIEILLDCLELLESGPNIELHIAGDGPLQSKVQEWIASRATKHSQSDEPQQNSPKCKVRYLGRLEKLDAQFAWAHFLLFPSIWYEGMPLILLESLCCGLPVIGFRLGAAAQMLFDCANSNIGGQNLGIGADFFCDEAALHELNLRRSHSPKELRQNFAAAIAEAAAINDADYSAMCAAARSNFAQHYSPKQNLAMLRAIYEPN